LSKSPKKEGTIKRSDKSLPFKKTIFAVLFSALIPLVCAAFELQLYHLKNDSSFDSIRQSKEWKALGGGFALGYDFGVHWFRILVRNDENVSKTYYVEFSEPFAHRCDFYVLKNGAVRLFQNGLTVPMDKRPVRSFLPTVKLELQPHESVYVYVKYESRFTSYGAFRVYDEEEWRHGLWLYSSIFTLYFGAVGIMALYNFFLFLSLRDIAYFYYVGHAFVFAIWVFLYSGLSLFFIDSSWHYVLHFTTPLAFVFFVFYSVTILRTKEYFPRLYRTFLMLAATLAIVSALVVVNLEVGYLLANAIGILFFPLLILLAVLSIRKGIKTAKFYLAALLPYLLTMSVVSNLAMGLIEYSSFAKFSFIGGSVVELTLFSLLLAYRIHLLRLEQMQMQNSLLELKATKEQELEKTVEEKTKELQQSNKRLEESLGERTLLLNEIHHRVKNNLQSITALLWMQGYRNKNDEAKAVLKESAAKIKSIATIHEMLYASENLKSIDMCEYLPKVAQNIVNTNESSRSSISYNIENIFLDADSSAAIGMISGEIITNSFKHAFLDKEELSINISLTRQKNRATLVISDNGKKEPKNLETGGMGMTLAAQMSSKLKNASYHLRYDGGVIFELEFDVE